MNSKIKDRAQIILAQIYFNHLEVNDIYSWTKFVRSCGFKSSKIDLLLNDSIRKDQEIVRLFLELKKELKIRTTKNPESFYKKYALNIAVQYLSKELSAEIALQKILVIIQEAEDKDHYLPFVNFCVKYDILKRYLKFKNLDILNLKKALKELDSIFLLFAEDSHELKLRIQLNKRSLSQLIKARYLNKEVYDKLSLFIIDDILLKDGISTSNIKSIIEKMKIQRK